MPRSKRRSAASALVLLSLALGHARARAAEPEPSTDLSFDWKVDGAVTVVAGLLWGGSAIFERRLAPASCRWCAPPGLDVAARDDLRWSDPNAANVASIVSAYALVPVASLGALALAAHHDDRSSELGGDALVIAEAVTVSGALTQLVKLTVGRERPFVHALPASEKSLTTNPPDNNLSFYSGHTSMAFSLAVSAGTVASIRHRRWAPLVWATGLAGAALTGYLRIAADKHYLTDVLAGAVMGSAVGFGLPTVFHTSPRAHEGTISVAPLPGGGTELSFAFRW